jgi:choloylglycine hydrolase
VHELSVKSKGRNDPGRSNDGVRSGLGLAVDDCSDWNSVCRDESEWGRASLGDDPRFPRHKRSGPAIRVDGLNDAGLYAGLLYLPGFAEYQAHEGVSPERLVAPDEVASLALSTSASVEEAVATIDSVIVWNKFEEQLKGTLPIHLVLHDRSGGFAVVEWVDGACSVHRSSLGVCTNSPPYAWHETNLRNYVNLSVINADPVELDGETFAQIGEGSGLLGLPGDWTPPSRFVRAAVVSSATTPPEDGASGSLTASQVLNAFDIPRGLVGGGSSGDYTQWVTVGDLESNVYMVRTYESTGPTQIRLADMGLSSGPVKQMPLPHSGQVEMLPA